MESVKSHLQNVGYLFYVASPNATTFKTVEEIPNYTNHATPYFLALVIIEYAILFFQNKQMRMNDAINSASHGMIYVVTSYMTRGIELVGYNWLYDRRFIDLDWSSPVTWWVAAFGVDFGYYWIHRFVHEVSLGWASHQVHHSSEEYNLTTALRQSLFQKFFSFGFYLPCAVIGVPLPALLVHLQFNLLYQFWIHTEVISTLGPLEWILNTPSHHRVHHGVDSWCLDKNYAGFLIIWDRMFGTFEPERKGEKITYGLVRQPKTLMIVKQQLFYYQYIFKKAASMKSWNKFFKVLFYPPSYNPDREDQKQLKRSEDSPNVSVKVKKVPRKKYNPTLSPLLDVYMLAHFLVSLFIQQTLLVKYHNISWMSVLLHMIYLFVTLGNIGAMYDGVSWAMKLEAVRCGIFVMVSSFYSFSDNEMLNTIVMAYHCFSSVLWTVKSVMISSPTAESLRKLE